MALQLYFKRSKIFLHTNDDGESKRYYATISTRGPVTTPSWLAETLTYKHGIRDGSIIDLTPPTKASKKKIEVDDSQYEQNNGAASTGADVKEGADPGDGPTLTDAEQVAATVGNGRPPSKQPKGFQSSGGGRNKVPGGTLET